MIDPWVDWPAFWEVREVLTTRFRCIVLPPPKNLFSPKPLTVFTRVVGGVDCEWHAYFNDSDLVAREHLLHACGRLRIYGIALTEFQVQPRTPP